MIKNYKLYILISLLICSSCTTKKINTTNIINNDSKQPYIDNDFQYRLPSYQRYYNKYRYKNYKHNDNDNNYWGVIYGYKYKNMYIPLYMGVQKHTKSKKQMFDKPLFEE